MALEDRPVAQCRQANDCPRKTGPAETQTRAQIFLTDSRVGTDRIQDHVDVGLGKLFRDHAKLVGEADLHCNVAVHRNLGQLCTDDRHPRDPAFVARVTSIKFLERGAALRIALAMSTKSGSSSPLITFPRQ